MAEFPAVLVDAMAVIADARSWRRARDDERDAKEAELRRRFEEGLSGG